MNSSSEGDDRTDENSRSIVQPITQDAIVPQREMPECRSPDGDIGPDSDTASCPEIDDAPIIGFDTEWCAHPKRKLLNIVLSYALHLLIGGMSVSLYKEPSGPDRHHRLSLNRLIGHVIQLAIAQDILRGWPARVYLVVHFGRGDLAACSDFKMIKSQISSVGGTLATAGRPASMNIETDEKSGLPLERLPRIPISRRINALDGAGNQHPVEVHFIDSFSLAPEGASLAALGELLGVKKLELPPGYDPSDMGRFQRERPDEFRAYNLADAKITALYFQRIARLCRDEFGLRHPPVTLGGCAVAIAREEMKKRNIDLRQDFGIERVRRRSYSRASNRQITSVQHVPGFARSLIDQAAASGYHGGRTETFITGPVSGVELRDIDLKSAYPTAMCAIGLPNFADIRLTRDVAQFTAGTLGVAQVEFETPPTVRYPAFGVRAESGLVFPRRGTTVATAPEISAAAALGIRVRVAQGIIVSWDTSVLPYESFVLRLLAAREKHKVGGKDTLESKMIKTITNSLYGKVAQAVRPRSTYDARTGGSRPLSPSAVTNPVLAAYTTGLVRAAIAEMLNSIPVGELVVSVSTDGFLTSADLADIDVSGPATSVLVAARRRLAALSAGARQ